MTSMAASSSSQSFCSLIPRTVLLVSVVLFLFPLQPEALKSPFAPLDMLPLLPRQVSWPILNYLNNADDLLPTFVGAVSSPNKSIQWQGACFDKNTAWLEFHNNSGSEFGGGTLHIKVCTCFILASILCFFRLSFVGACVCKLGDSDRINVSCVVL